MTAPTRYVQVGLGVRSWIFSIAIADTYREASLLVGLCDDNPGRLAQRASWAQSQGLDAPAYAASDFDRMLAKRRPDRVVVTTPDRDHAHYVCAALEAGCDVISEKPLTIDAPSLERILKARRDSGRRVVVAFNYRYSPPRAQVKELLDGGAIGDVLSVDFHWHLDTRHGADYFRRWHRRKENSGGLLVHKATHHFDLVNWWLGSTPEVVQASGDRRFYTPANADAMGLARRADRCLGCPEAEPCPFHLDLAGDGFLDATYRQHEHHDGYFRDRCVFSDQIDIEDTMNVLVDYRSGARMSYSLNAFLPREGYTVSFNGTKGRLDHVCEESSYVSGQNPIAGALDVERTRITLQRNFERAVDVPIASAEGSHGGGDALLMADLFSPEVPDDPLGRRADHRAGAWSILTGIAANASIAQSQRIVVDALTDEVEALRREAGG